MCAPEVPVHSRDTVDAFRAGPRNEGAPVAFRGNYGLRGRAGRAVKKVEDYYQHADECREMVKCLRSAEQREMVLNMARTWQFLAESRATALARKRRLQALDRRTRSYQRDSHPLPRWELRMSEV
jgi:hypothetical protein